MNAITESTQDYLKYIYELTEDGQPAATSALAACLGVSPASVTGMVQKMASSEPPLVEYRKHQGARLTPEGERAALEVIRHHRLVETWLVQSLGYTWDEVHEEACRLEHVVSENLEARIAKTLGDPQRDPHGDPIPDASLVMPRDKTQTLSSLLPGQRAVIQRVNDEAPEFLRHLEGLGLVPDGKINVLDYSPFDQNLTIEVDEQASVVLGTAITSKIFVSIVEPEKFL